MVKLEIDTEFLLSRHKSSLTCQIHLSTFLSIFVCSLINYFTYLLFTSLLQSWFNLTKGGNPCLTMLISVSFQVVFITLPSHLHKYRKKNVISPNFLEASSTCFQSCQPSQIRGASLSPSIFINSFSTHLSNAWWTAVFLLSTKNNPQYLNQNLVSNSKGETNTMKKFHIRS